MPHRQVVRAVLELALPKNYSTELFDFHYFTLLLFCPLFVLEYSRMCLC